MIELYCSKCRKEEGAEIIIKPDGHIFLEFKCNICGDKLMIRCDALQEKSE